jgi:hypothetical protein
MLTFIAYGIHAIALPPKGGMTLIFRPDVTLRGNSNAG